MPATPTPDPVPDDIEALRAALLHERAALAAEQLARREAEARASGAEAMVAHLKLLIAKLKHDRFGASSERGRKLLDQLELQLEELEAAAAEDEAALDPDQEGLPPRRTLRRKPVRGPLPAHLPRERVVIPGPTEPLRCQGRLAKLRDRRLDHGRLGRRVHGDACAADRADRGARDGGRSRPWRWHHRARAGARQDGHRPPVDLCARRPAVRRTGTARCRVPLLARPQGRAPEQASGWLCRHPAGGRLCRVQRPLPSRAQARAGDRGRLLGGAGQGSARAASGIPAEAHGRRKLFDLAKVARAPLAAEAVRRIDAIFDIERSINGLPAEQRLALRQTHVAPLVAGLETWMRAARGKMSRHAEVAKAMDYMLKRWDTFSRFLGDGRICLSNNAAERALRGIALGRKAWLFAGSDRGGDRAAAMYSLIVTAKLNDVDPRAWLADVLRRIADHPASRLHELLPWNWGQPTAKLAA